VSRELVDALVIPNRTVLPRTDSVGYVAFVDPSGGSSDSMTLAISHMEGDRAILDLVVERGPPFSPDDVTKEFAATIRSCGIASVRGDRYSGLWPASTSDPARPPVATDQCVRNGMMVDNLLVDGRELEPAIEKLLRPTANYLHIHFAAAGCYATGVESRVS
jgi:hypothetical protein